MEKEREDRINSISAEATVSASARLGDFVVVKPKVKIEDECIVLDGAVLGRLPIANRTVTRRVQSTYSELRIGRGSIIGANSVLYTGSQIGEDVLIGDLSSIREGCEIADDVVIGRSVMVLYNCKIGARSRIQDQAHIVGEMVIEEDVFIGMGVMTTNDNDVYLTRFGLAPAKMHAPIIRRLASVGAGSTILPGIEIGIGALVGAGAVVTKDVAPWTVVAGVPARVMREIAPEVREQLLAAEFLKAKKP